MIKRSGFVSNSSSSSFIIQAHPQYKAKELTEEYIRTKILDPDIKLEYEFYCAEDDEIITMDSIANFLFTGKGQYYNPNNDSCSSKLVEISEDMKKRWVYDYIDYNSVNDLYNLPYEKFDNNNNEERYTYHENLQQWLLKQYRLEDFANFLNNYFIVEQIINGLCEESSDLRMELFDICNNSMEYVKIKEKYDLVNQLIYDKYQQFLSKYFNVTTDELNLLERFWKDSDKEKDDNEEIEYDDLINYRISKLIEELMNNIYGIVFKKLFKDILLTYDISRSIYIFEVQGAGDGWKSAESDFLYNHRGIRTIANPEIGVILNDPYEIIKNAVKMLYNRDEYYIDFEDEYNKKAINDLIEEFYNVTNFKKGLK